jgi:hypothetical protein
MRTLIAVRMRDRSWAWGRRHISASESEAQQAVGGGLQLEREGGR